jgi:aspartate racemase
MDKQKKTIGIVGGVGPYAGLDLNRKIFDHTLATNDQEHLPVLMASFSETIPDRTRYLLHGDVENPARGLYRVVALLNSSGATVAGIPCNTAHAQPIFHELVKRIHAGGLQIRLLNMISEVIAEVKSTFTGDTLVGILSTLGTYESGLYEAYFRRTGIPLLQPDKALAENVHAAIYHPDFGIKARSSPVTKKAGKIIKSAVRKLGDQGAEAVILGCTELPIALPCDTFQGIRLIDPATILARALIRDTYPEKLKPITG